ncbi:MAG: hypothetical protein HN411_00360 [Waddliaceae bacterium]|jgi:membrane protein GlpM|nr:hypothetical protein [Waddliaceae bacterium]MBT3578983.1 hypothetical protein [Waddliaceae bacterium]MBT4444667.1 hypothetical protein [Waddliaceae bacterium]MBT6929180.1 hypothetical protein [Waddliaceae bacterium]MBT7265154.1 hypothetical protein [Waddliaceae bacterium]
MFDLSVKAIIGALVVVAIGLVTKTRYYFLAGLLPLFPTFALMGHYIAGNANTPEQFREIVIFGMLAIIPYFIYLGTVYFFHTKMTLIPTLSVGVIAWALSSVILVFIWNRY